MSNDYRDAGVDIEAGEEAVRRIKKVVRTTYNSSVISDLGSFGGLFALDTERWKHPVLVSSTDGVGTKLMVARVAGRFDTVGQDLVNHCVNDIFVQGAEPLFFLDYIGVGHLEPERMALIIEGMSKACRENGVALIGGEMAEMPGIYSRDDFDLVGTIVGVVERGRVITGEKACEGDTVIGFPSTGLHTNGYSLARKVLFQRGGLPSDDRVPGLDGTLVDALLTVHRSYYPLLKPWTSRLHAMAHITGGGIPGNLKRVIPDGLTAEINTTSWAVPRLFEFIREQGRIEKDEMYRAFNMGIGFIVVTNEATAEHLLAETDGIRIGHIVTAQDTLKVRML